MIIEEEDSNIQSYNSEFLCYGSGDGGGFVNGDGFGCGYEVLYDSSSGIGGSIGFGYGYGIGDGII